MGKKQSRANDLSSREFVLKRAHEYDVKFIRLWFSDIFGLLKSFAIPIEELDKAMEEGIGFDGSSISGFAHIEESDMLAKPDPNTFQILPWRPSESAVARMFCNVILPNGKVYESSPRHILKRTLQKAHARGYLFYVGPELEHFYLKSPSEVKPIDSGGYLDLTPFDSGTNLRRDTVLMLEQVGVNIAYSHHEISPGQHEMGFRYDDAMTIADNVMTYRLVVKQIAMKHGFYATFMPKPMKDENGSGMHIHMSLFKDGKNIFFDKKDRYRLSPIGKAFLAGILKHSKDFMLVTNQWVNSYKRFVSGYEAPTHVCWARKNRSTLIRVPAFRHNKPESCRIETRCPDPSCNPYLSFALLLCAGLDGIDNNLELPKPVEENIHQLSPAQIKKLKLDPLPTSLYEAIQNFKQSKLAKEVLGTHVFNELIELKTREWDRYNSQVTKYEIDKYLPML